MLVPNEYLQSRFYDTFNSYEKGALLQGTFQETDPTRHAPYKSAVCQMYSMSSIRQVEPMIEECTDIFMGIMSELSDYPVNLGEWLQFYAFDVIGAISFNRRFGFLKERRDVGYMIAGLESGLAYFSHCGQVPELHPYLLGSKFVPKLQEWFPSLKEFNPIRMVQEVSYVRFISKAMGRVLTLYFANVF